MQVIHSDAALQRLLTRFNDPAGWSNLAKNQYLSTAMKQKFGIALYRIEKIIRKQILQHMKPALI